MTTEGLRSFCLKLPGTVEGIKWEDHLCFMVGGKIFLITGMGDGDPVSIKVTEEDFELLCERAGITQAPYMAKNQWVAVTRRNVLRREEWQHYINASYELIKSKLPKKLQREIEGT